MTVDNLMEGRRKRKKRNIRRIERNNRVENTIRLMSCEEIQDKKRKRKKKRRIESTLNQIAVLEVERKYKSLGRNKSLNKHDQDHQNLP